MDDNYSLFQRREAQREARLRKRPVCCYCEEHIQDDQLFDINGELYCRSCLISNFRKDTEDYME